MEFEGNSAQALKDKNTGCPNNNKENSGSLSATFNQLFYIQNNQNALDLAEQLFRCGGEILQQIEGDQYFSIISRSLLALVYLKKGQWDKALVVGKNAFHDALLQGGTAASICEMVLSMILMEKGVKSENNQEAIPQRKDNPYFFRIQMFGPFRVFYHSEEINTNSWRTVKSRELLAYLAHQDKPVSTDQILEDLWPDLNSDKASAVFHTTLYYLRRLLQQYTNEEIIIHGSRRYQLRPGSILIDRCQFEEAAQRALGKTMTAALANELETILSLYRGDYLEDLDYQWVIPVQEKLKNMNISLKLQLAVYYLENKMYPQALVHLRQLIAENPYSEEVLRLLLTTLAGMGDLLAVKKEYTVFVKTLLKELGIRPSLATTAFYRELCETGRNACLNPLPVILQSAKTGHLP